MFYAIIFAATLGSGSGDLKPQFSTGPFPTVTVCAAFGALAMDHLKDLHPTTEFRLQCARDNQIAYHAGIPIWSIQAASEIATAQADVP